MRIHSDSLTNRDLIDAANIARVEFDRWLDKGSRTRDHAFDVTLFGESRRRPNDRGRSSGTDKYAATWDQWGVFLSVLYDRDNEMVVPYYDSMADFHYKTDHRFEKRTEYFTPGGSGVVVWWPADAHGDHNFQWSGVPGASKCTKCSAVRRWM